MSQKLPQRSELAQHWTLDPEVVFLNHGSYGACPREVQAAQSRFKQALEAEPIRFFHQEMDRIYDRAREVVAEFVGCTAKNLAFVTNATTGVNTVLRSLTFRSEDEILLASDEYNACMNAVNRVCELSGAKVVVAPLPFPISEPSEVIDAVLSRVTPKTKLVLLDHIVSTTANITPVKEIVGELNLKGIDVLIDGAHAAGAIELNIEDIGAAFYTGNFHKWTCAPKGSGFLWVREDKLSQIRPLVISHGANATRTDKSRFHLEFDWLGTNDPSAVLAAGVAVSFLDGLVPGGWMQIRKTNHELLSQAISCLSEKTGSQLLSGRGMFQCMAVLKLPERLAQIPPEELSNRLLADFSIRTMILTWPGRQEPTIRISAHLYNSLAEFEYLADALQAVY